MPSTAGAEAGVQGQVFSRFIQAQAISLLKANALTFHELLQSMGNCDPLVLKEALGLLEQNGFVRSGRSYSVTRRDEPFPSVSLADPTFGRCRHRLPLCSPPRFGETNKKELVADLKNSLPEPAPVYYQWWFEDSCYPLLARTLMARVSRTARVAFVGAPTLGTYFSNVADNHVAIIDIDKSLVERLRPLAGKNVDFVIFDVCEEDDGLPRNKFDVVYLDPPWSFGLTVLFLQAAARLCAPGGDIYLSLPPINTREGVLRERTEMGRLLSTWGLETQLFWPSCLAYDVPIFEKTAYARSGISLTEPWRRGDLLLLAKARSLSCYPLIWRPPDRERWDELTVATCRFFLKTDARGNGHPPAINLVPGYTDFYLRRTSSREPGRLSANLLTSRGHCAIGTHVPLLRDVIEQMAQANTSRALRARDDKVPNSLACDMHALQTTLLGFTTEDG